MSLSACIGSGGDTWTTEEVGAFELRAAAAVTTNLGPYI